ncbi:hypothetical protein IEU_05611 [Bacillus mycoides]|nr:hypothetical protein IEU_05611 [Bacillus mycoides]
MMRDVTTAEVFFWVTMAFLVGAALGVGSLVLLWWLL